MRFSHSQICDILWPLDHSRTKPKFRDVHFAPTFFAYIFGEPTG